jgi:hypothetical protein
MLCELNSAMGMLIGLRDALNLTRNAGRGLPLPAFPSGMSFDWR